MSAPLFPYQTTSPKVSSAERIMSCSHFSTSPVALQARVVQSFACSIGFTGLLNYVRTLPCYAQKRRVARDSSKCVETIEKFREREEFLKELEEIRSKSATSVK